MHDALEITSHAAADGTRLYRLSGRLDSRSTRHFVRDCPAPAGPGECVVVNLSGITFLSSSGIGALLAISEQARERGGVFRIAEPAQVVSATIDLLNLREYLDVRDREDDALQRAA